MDKRDVVQSCVLDGTNNPSQISVFSSIERFRSCARTLALYISVCCFSSLFSHFFYVISQTKKLDFPTNDVKQWRHHMQTFNVGVLFEILLFEDSLSMNHIVLL